MAVLNASLSSTNDEMISSGKVGPITWDDATWILTSSFIIFTMQSGFGLLEAGCVSGRNEVNIMVKNAIDVIFGGLSYWIFGFGFSFGADNGTNPFNGIGEFLVDATYEDMGIVYSTFVFQMSFATTATTIVSGAMAERTKLCSYVLFSFFNTLIYCMPAHWEWSEYGFLRNLGVVDIAGSGAVHLTGGTSALVAAIYLKPRLRRKAAKGPLPMGNPVSALIGMFMLWWGWLAFNCGSTFGISGAKWKLAAKAAVTTLNASVGGGSVGIIISYIIKKRKFDVSFIIDSVLGGLVAITAGCAVVRPWEAIIIGAIGGVTAISFSILLERIGVDDPVHASPVHGFCGIWSMLSVGLFADKDPLENTTLGRAGLFRGGGFYLIGIQLLACVTIIAWSSVLTFFFLSIIRCLVGLRLSEKEEILGADFVEHGISLSNVEDEQWYQTALLEYTVQDQVDKSQSDVTVVCQSSLRLNNNEGETSNSSCLNSAVNRHNSFPDNNVNNNQGSKRRKFSFCRTRTSGSLFNHHNTILPGTVDNECVLYQ